MKALSRCSATLVSALCACCLAPVQVRASIIVGISFDQSTFTSTTYSVDPITGVTTRLGSIPGGFVPVSSSPAPGTFFAQTPNIFRVNLITGDVLRYGCVSDPTCGGATGDMAYNSDRGWFDTLGIASGVPQAPGDLSLFRLVDTGTMPSPGFEAMSYQYIGDFGLGATGFVSIQTIEFIPGLGLYCIGGGNSYLIDEATGHATLLGVAPPITGWLTTAIPASCSALPGR